MTSVDEITKEFIATYYRILSNQGPSQPPLFQMYNSHAQISRKWPNNENTSYSFKLVNDPMRDVCPDDLRNSDVKVSSYNGTKVNDNILINVYGEFIKKATLLHGFWVQEFVLQRYEARWFIINDNFFSFTGINLKLIGAEAPIQAAPIQQQQQVFAPQHIAQATSSLPSETVTGPMVFAPQPAMNASTTIQQIPLQGPQPQAPTSSFQSHYSSNHDSSMPSRSYSNPYYSGRGDRKLRYEMMNPDRSITIYLYTKYSGDDVYNHFLKYGDITDKYYTHGAVYLEFKDQRSRDAALNGPPLIINGSQARVENGISKSSKGRPR